MRGIERRAIAREGREERSALPAFSATSIDTVLEREIEQLNVANTALAEEVRGLRTDPARSQDMS
jgi:hypothetical protein